MRPPHDAGWKSQRGKRKLAHPIALDARRPGLLCELCVRLKAQPQQALIQGKHLLHHML